MPFLNRFLTVLFFLSLSAGLCAQSETIEGIKKQLSKPGIHDTLRLQLINDILANSIMGDSTSRHYNKMVARIIFRELSRKNISKKERDTYLYYLAYWYCDKAGEIYSVKNGRQVIAYYDKAIELFNRVGKKPEAWSTMANKGNILRKTGAYEEAIACFFSALKQQEAAGDKDGATVAYSGLATVYEEQLNYPMALFYYKKALKIYDSMKDPLPQQLYEKAIMLHNTGFIYAQMDRNDLARPYYEKAMKIDRENGFDDQAAFNAEKIGLIYFDEKNYPVALEWLNEGLSLAESERSKCVLLDGTGRVYFMQGDLKKAESYFKQALAISTEIQDQNLIELNYLHLYRTYKKMNKPALALQMHELYIQTGNKGNSEATRNALAQQQLRYDYEKREIMAKAKAQKKLDAAKLAGEQAAARRNLFIYILLSVAVILGGVIWFIYYFFRQKAIQNLHRNNELKQKLLLSQMNPHFIFNSVDNIQSLIYQGKDKDAISYLTRFSRLTRQILEHSRENYIMLSEEIEMLTNYLSIQQLLYNSSFTFEINTSADIDPEMLLVPPMLSQPFIENAIKHGLKDLEKGGVVRINYAMKAGELVFEVTDNGSGFTENTSGHKSLSSQITRERLESIAPESNVEIEMSDIYSENVLLGARTRFAIPYLLNN